MTTTTAPRDEVRPGVITVFSDIWCSFAHVAMHRLHTTREELVLSFVPAAGTKRVRWNRGTIEDALRYGFRRSFHDLEARGCGRHRNRRRRCPRARSPPRAGSRRLFRPERGHASWLIPG